jgi:phage-related protein
LGDSLDRLRKLKDAARRAAGHELRLVQSGLPATDWRPMPVIGNGVAEIRIHAKGEYRFLYVARFEDAIYVIHVFGKKTRKTSLLDVELGRKRYRALMERLR